MSPFVNISGSSLKLISLFALTTPIGRLFENLTPKLVKKNLLIANQNLSMASLSLFVLLPVLSLSLNSSSRPLGVQSPLYLKSEFKATMGHQIL